MLTRAQAAETWCPMTNRLRELQQVAIVRNINDVTDDLRSDLRTLADDGLLPDTAMPTKLVTRCCCIADKCAMWRSDEKAPAPRDQKVWWCDEEEPKVEPPRPDRVPKDAVWVPLTGEGEDQEGGCWEESQAMVDAENAEIAAGRLGHCGLAGPVAFK